MGYSLSEPFVCQLFWVISAAPVEEAKQKYDTFSGTWKFIGNLGLYATPLVTWVPKLIAKAFGKELAILPDATNKANTREAFLNSGFYAIQDTVGAYLVGGILTSLEFALGGTAHLFASLEIFSRAGLREFGSIVLQFFYCSNDNIHEGRPPGILNLFYRFAFGGKFIASLPILCKFTGSAVLTKGMAECQRWALKQWYRIPKSLPEKEGDAAIAERNLLFRAQQVQLRANTASSTPAVGNKDVLPNTNIAARFLSAWTVGTVASVFTIPLDIFRLIAHKVSGSELKDFKSYTSDMGGHLNRFVFAPSAPSTVAPILPSDEPAKSVGLGSTGTTPALGPHSAGLTAAHASASSLPTRSRGIVGRVGSGLLWAWDRITIGRGTGSKHRLEVVTRETTQVGPDGQQPANSNSSATIGGTGPGPNTNTSAKP